MKLLDRRPPAATAEPEVAPIRWTGPQAAATTAVTWLMIAALVAGPIALIGVCAQWLTTSPTSTAPVRDLAGETYEAARVAAFAETVVSTWLSTPRGQEARLDSLVDTSTQLKLPSKPFTIADTATAGVQPAGGGLWSVTVATTVDGTRRYFQVPIAVQADSLIATNWPAPIAGPASAKAPSLAYNQTVSATDPLSTAAEQFLSALLAGGGDLTRLITPGSHIRAVTPAPYRLVDVTRVRSSSPITTSPTEGQQVHLLVDAIATAGTDQEISITYPLELTVREGRWEITAIDPTPHLNQ